ncbi:MAG: beta-propeller fold lactonase family protein [Bacteroidales bacterium]|nr:beta-propeller fold lactonase family protein [Bacteroidales bacterium]
MRYEDKILTADYSGGSVTVFPLCDGILGDCIQRLEFQGEGPVEGRQESSHIHQLKLIPDTDWILASDLGADRIRLLRFEDGILIHKGDFVCPAGSGPRHLEFSRDGKTLYCISELSGNVLVYSTGGNETPEFTLIQQIQADEVNAGGSADIHLHPSGKYLYTSHRLDNDGIAIFKTLPDGRIEKIGYSRTGRHPRNFCISPDGSLLFVACRDDRIIQVFHIEDNGHLTLTPSVLRFEEDMPSNIYITDEKPSI